MAYRNDMHLCEISVNPIKLYGIIEKYSSTAFSNIITFHLTQIVFNGYYLKQRKGIKYSLQ